MLALLDALLIRHHGVVTTANLNAADISEYQVKKWLADSVLTKIHRGKYCNRLPDSPIGIARLLSGSLTCLSALEFYKLWVPQHPATPHIRVIPNRRKSFKTIPALTRVSQSAHIHSPTNLPQFEQPSRLVSHPDVDNLGAVLLTAANCCTRNELVAVADSALRAGVPITYLRGVADYGNATLREVIHRLLDPGSGSGAESIARMHLHKLRLRVRSQVRILGWPVDLLIGDWLVIEIDGFAYHSKPADADRDKFKDRMLHEAGFTVLRYSYRSIFFEWEKCEDQLLRITRAGRHQKPTFAQAPRHPFQT